MAGGLKEYAHRSDIAIMRTEGARQLSFGFDYAAVAKRTKLDQNIALKPGDIVVVP
jgi:protein involved in polysaccharide export with SLBB domain